MKLVPRFVFHGTAVAFGGRLLRPADIVLDPGCAASLPRTGGRSTATHSGGAFGEVVRFGRARARAEGVFDDFDQAVELTYGRVAEHTMSTSTTVMAEIENVEVQRPVLTVDRLRAALLSRSAAADAETPILLADDIAIDGVAFDGRRLLVDLDVALFREHGGSFISPTRGPVHGTIVKSLRWDGAPYPGAVLDRHAVTMPDFGRVFFGEISIDHSSRRLTMMRVELASSHGGHLAFAEVEISGMWRPSH